MNTARDICKVLSRGELQKKLGVTPPAVSNALKKGVFPSRWYLVMDRMCSEAGVNCPRSLFDFIGSGLERPPRPLPDDETACTVPDSCVYRDTCRRAAGHKISAKPKPVAVFGGGPACSGRVFDNEGTDT